MGVPVIVEGRRELMIRVLSRMPIARCDSANERTYRRFCSNRESRICPSLFFNQRPKEHQLVPRMSTVLPLS